METLFSTLLARKPLHEYGMKESEIKGFTDSVIESQQRLLSNSAIPLSRDEIHSIYKALFDCAGTDDKTAYKHLKKH